MSGSNQNSMLTPFDFILTKLNFVTSSGQIVDLRFIYVELNIYQDIFSNCMSGICVVTDSTNIFAYLVSQGSEFIQISYDKPGLNKPVDQTFRVYAKIIKPIKMSNQQVELKFCSEELMISKGMKFSKSYNGMLISDMVKDIITNVLKIPASKFPSTNIETTTNVNIMNIPHYNPLQVINWLCTRSTSSYVGATFLFYENQTGFNFQSLQKLMSASPVATYNISMKNIDDNNPNLDFYDVSRHEIVNTPNTMESLMGGKSASRLITIDPLRQVYKQYDLNGDDLFNSSVTLNPGKQYNNFQDRLGHTMATSYDAHRKFFITNTGQDTAQYIQGKVPPNQSNVEKWLVERQAQLMTLLGLRLKIVVPGNSLLKVGDVITLNLPSIEPQVGSSEGSYQRKLDPYYSGNYLITAIRNRFDIRIFETVVEICSDSLAQNLPGAINTNTGVASGT